MSRLFSKSAAKPRPMRLRVGPSGTRRGGIGDWRWRATWGLLTGLIVGALTMAALERHPVGLKLQHEAMDYWFSLRGGQSVREVAMIGVDEATQREWSGRDFDADALAQLLTELKRAKVRGVLLALPDLTDEKISPRAQNALMKAMRENGRVWIGVDAEGRDAKRDYLRDTENREGGGNRDSRDLHSRDAGHESLGARDFGVLPGDAATTARLQPLSAGAQELLSAARGAGHLSLLVDAGGRVHLLPLRVEGRGRLWNALCAQAVAGAVGASGARAPGRAFGFGPRRAPALLLNYPHEAPDPERPYTWSPFPRLSFLDALRAPEKLRRVSGRWVVIGPMARADETLFCPLGTRVSPLEVQAVALDNLLTARAIRPAPNWWRWLLALLPCAVVGGFAAARRPGWSGAVAVLCACGAAFLSFAAWNQEIWLDFCAPCVGIALTLCAGSFARARWRDRQVTRVASAIEALTQASELIAAQKNSDQLLPRVLAWAESALRARGASVLLLDPDGQTLSFASATCPKSQELMSVTMQVGQGIAGWVAQEGVPAVVNEAAYDWRFNEHVDRRVGFHTRSLLAVPLKVRDHTLGVIEVVNRRDGQPFDETDAELLLAVANQAALVLENARLYERLASRVEESESELSRANNRLQAEKTLLQTVLQSMTDGVVVTDRRGLVQLMNQAASSLLPELGPTTLGRPLEDTLPELVRADNQSDVETKRNSNGASLNGAGHGHGSGQVVARLPFSSEFAPPFGPCVLFRGDMDAPRVIEARSAPLMRRDESARMKDEERATDSPVPVPPSLLQSGRIWVFTDVTEARNVERAKSDFVSFVAHEMRSPLTSISGFSSMLLKQEESRNQEQESGAERTILSPAACLAPPAASSRARFLGIIRDESERLTRLINNLLDVARIEAGRDLDLTCEVWDVAPLLHAAGDSQRSYSSRHRIVCEIAPNLPPVFADRDKVLQVLINLVSNALKYSPGGTVTLRAEVMSDECRVPGGATHHLLPVTHHLLFSVSDQGPGIEIADRARLFSRFERGTSRAPVGGAGSGAKPTGTGLGLFLSRYLVEAHGGRIWVDDGHGDGQGAMFCFTLPVAGEGESGRN